MADLRLAAIAAAPTDRPDPVLLAAAMSALDLPVAVLAAAPQGGAPDIVHANEALCTLAGCTAGQLDATPFADLIAPAEAAIVQAVLGAALHDGTLQRCTAALRRRDGRAAAVALSFQPLPAGDAGPGHALCTARQAARDADTVPDGDATHPLQEIVDTLDDGFVLFDHNDRILLFNRRIMDIYPERAHLYRRGTPLADLLRAGIAGGSLLLDGETPEEFVAKTRRQALDVEGVHQVQLGDGRIIRISRRWTSAGRLVIHTDITALNQAYRLLSDAVEAMTEGFALYDPDDRLVVANQRLREIHADSADVMVPGASFADVLLRTMEVGTWTATPDDLDGYVAERVRRRREQGEGAIERSMANDRWLRISGKLLPDGHYVAIHSDITEQKRRELDLYDAKQNAELANQAKSDFLANVSHELRTPLNAILGFSEVMSKEMFGPLGSTRYVGYVGDVHSSARHLLELINDLLDMSKIEAGKYTLHDEYFDLAPLVEECLREMEPLRVRGNLDIDTAIPDDLPQLRADKRALRQVLTNLLSNAIKFSDAGGRVRVDVRIDAGAFVVTVSDTGIGIPAADLERLARPFQQVGELLTSPQTGTGLGLSISRSLVEIHGGRLDIDSTFGRGTAVSFRLPASRNAAEAY